LPLGLVHAGPGSLRQLVVLAGIYIEEILRDAIGVHSADKLGQDIERNVGTGHARNGIEALWWQS
jgi:hypothetical protein